VNKEVPVWLARTAMAVGVVLAVILLVLLWPQRFGGKSELLVVHGDSMEPTFGNGDIVFVRSRESYHVGDSVVFRIPSGPAHGMRVVHRITAIDAMTGSLTTRGDNRLTDDHFGITVDDVDGRVVLHVPWAGQVLFVMSRWWFLAPVLGVLAALVLWPRRVAPVLGAVADDGPA
jgi:signal peptidase I